MVQKYLTSINSESELTKLLKMRHPVNLLLPHDNKSARIAWAVVRIPDIAFIQVTVEWNRRLAWSLDESCEPLDFFCILLILN
jgi:hypothetical protein